MRVPVTTILAGQGRALRPPRTVWAIYEIRRILRPRKTDPTKLGNAVRSVRIRGRGPRAGMHNILGRLATDGAAQNKVRPDIGDDGILRV